LLGGEHQLDGLGVLLALPASPRYIEEVLCTALRHREAGQAHALGLVERVAGIAELDGD
jgi:hypothetical protein